MSSTTVMPAQAVALVELTQIDGAIGLEVADDKFWSLRVAVFIKNPDDSPEAPPASARWYSVSVDGTVREIAPTPAEVAA